MTQERLSFGKSGEEAAAVFLKSQGYRIVARNYRTRLGELDIIAWDKDTLCVVEVKARASRAFGLPWEAIDARKRRQLSKAALCFLKEKKLFNTKARFDVVAVMGDAAAPQVEVIKNAFELDAAYRY